MYSRPKGVWLACILLLTGLAPMSALATIQWSFSPSCSIPPCATDSGEFKTFLGTDASSSGAGPIVAASGWSNTAAGAGGSVSYPGSDSNPYPGSDTNLAIGKITQGRSGLGVANASETRPRASSMDNNQNIDLILFQFCVPPADVTAPDGEACVPEEVALSEISLWQRSQEVWQADLDVSVLAYTGGGIPDLTGREYFASSEDLTANGWEIIGNYNAGSNPLAINRGNVSSSLWIVSSYNPALCKGGNCVPNSLDHLEITGLKGDLLAPTSIAKVASATAMAVPAPSTLLLLLAGGVPLIRRMSLIRAERAHC